MTKEQDINILNELKALQAKHNLSDINVAYIIGTTSSYFTHYYNSDRAISDNMHDKIICLINILEELPSYNLYRLSNETKENYKRRKHQALTVIKKMYDKNYEDGF